MAETDGQLIAEALREVAASNERIAEAIDNHGGAVHRIANALHDGDGDGIARILWLGLSRAYEAQWGIKDALDGLGSLDAMAEALKGEKRE